MSLRCKFSKHEPAGRPTTNQGMDFTQCRRCRRDLIRAGRKWVTIPYPLRVVWRPRAEEAPTDSGPAGVATVSRNESLALCPPPSRQGDSFAQVYLDFVRFGAAFLVWRIGDQIRNSRLPGPPPVIRLSAPEKILVAVPAAVKATPPAPEVQAKISADYAIRAEYRTVESGLDRHIDMHFVGRRTCGKCGGDAPFYHSDDGRAHACGYCGHKVYSASASSLRPADINRRHPVLALRRFPVSPGAIAEIAIGRRSQVTPGMSRDPLSCWEFFDSRDPVGDVKPFATSGNGQAPGRPAMDWAARAVTRGGEFRLAEL